VWDSIGLLRKLRYTPLFIALLFIVYLVGFVWIFVIGIIPTLSSAIASLVCLAWTVIGLLLIYSALCVVVCSVTHPGSGSDNLARCASLYRGAEQEWREYPVRVFVIFSDSGSSTMLIVHCFFLIGEPHMLVRTCRAIAELDATGLGSLDREIPRRQTGMILGGLGGLGSTILKALALVSLFLVSPSGMVETPRLQTKDVLAKSERSEHEP
jgi:hypothetical protein